MPYTWLSLLPPLIVIVSVLITRKINIALLFGILSAALIVAQGNLITMSSLTMHRTFEHLTDIDNIYLYIFLIAISSIITLFTHTGSATACAHIISKRVKTKRGAETSSILLSFLMSIDDYLSILTVGIVMRPLADRLAIARTRLAFLVHSLAGSVVILTPISSWTAAILSQLDQAGINLNSTQNSKILADPFFVYLNTLPFMFYSLFIIASVWFIVRKQLSYGKLHQHEQRTEKQKITPQRVEMSAHKNQHSLAELLVPLGFLLGSVIIGILYTGGYHLFGGQHSFIDAFRYNNQTFFVMCISGCIAFAISCLMALRKRMLRIQEIPGIVIGGFILMYGAIQMVILASILGTFLQQDLMTGSYLAYLFLGSVPYFLLPVMIFITSLVITLATGSAWGTFALMLPITVQMLIALFKLTPPVDPEAITILFPALGAIFSGAVCGDHISPFSETTVMTATSTGTTPLNHAYTQLPYALPAIISTLLAFIVAGLLSLYPLWVQFAASIIIGIGTCLSMLYLLSNLMSKSKKS